MHDLRQTIRVLVADDSSAARSLYRMLFAPATMLGASMFARAPLPGLELCGVVADGIECLKAVHALKPDILVLDLEMPRMDGLAVLDRLREEGSKLPVIVCSSMTERGAAITLDSLARGAMDYVTKPSVQGNVEVAMVNLGRQLLPRILAISGAHRQIAHTLTAQTAMAVNITSATPVLHRRASTEPPYVVVIGISTGGPAALEHLLSALPADFPVPILIAQHMPRLFSAVLAERLDRHSALQREACRARRQDCSRHGLHQSRRLAHGGRLRRGQCRNGHVAASARACKPLPPGRRSAFQLSSAFLRSEHTWPGDDRHGQRWAGRLAGDRRRRRCSSGAGRGHFRRMGYARQSGPRWNRVSHTATQLILLAN
jgi:chemotaxis response regulator CheB